jgi:DNA-directed RNA polymerase alpha subunit
MKILQTRTAPNPRRVRIFLAEKGIEVPYEELDLMKGALKTPEFTQLNWFQRVPILILDDGFHSSHIHKDFSVMLVHPGHPYFYLRHFKFLSRRDDRMLSFHPASCGKRAEKGGTYGFAIEKFLDAGDLIGSAEVEIVNPELLLLTADAPEVDLDIELTVNRGRGYSPAEERGKLPLGEIPVDAIYTPVRKVNFSVSRARIGQQTNYDRIVLEIWTDGTMTPEFALRESAKILVRHLALIAGADALPIGDGGGEVRGIPSRTYDVPIEELELTVRAYNCLKRAGITKVGEVLERLEKGEEEILAIRNFGRKSLGELIQRLQDKGFLSAISYEPSSHSEDSDEDGEADEDLL